MFKILRKYLLPFLIFFLLVNVKSEDSFFPLTESNRNLQTSLSITLSKKEALINAIKFTIHFKDSSYDNKEIYTYLTCDDNKQINLIPITVSSTDATVSKLLSNSEVLKYMNSTTESLNCNVEIGLANSGPAILLSDQNITLVKARTSNEISFKYLEQEKAISYKSIIISHTDATPSYYEIAYPDEISDLKPITQDEIILDKNKKLYTLIVYNQNYNIIHIAIDITIFSEEDIITTHHRKFYITNQVSQTVRVSLN